MISFDPSKLITEYVQLKTVSTALGGSITVVDQSRTSSKETYKRISVPLALARAFIARSRKVSRYLKPVHVAVVSYDGHIVAMERHPLAGLGALEEEGPDGVVRRWIPQCEHHMKNILLPTVSRGKRWFFDGRYVFSFDNNDHDVVIRNGEYMTQSGHFRKIEASTIDLHELHNVEKIVPSVRECLAFVAASGAYSISPPVWKKLADVGGTHLLKVNISEEDEDDDFEEPDLIKGYVVSKNQPELFDKIDASMSVNLRFVLKAGKEIGHLFGYEYVEPLQLARLMIELHTVNLPNVPAEVKATYDCGMEFTHALAWLLGLARRADTLETYMVMRSLLKFLTKSGIFRKNTFNADQVLLPNVDITQIQLKNLDDLMKQDFTKMTLSRMMQNTNKDD